MSLSNRYLVVAAGTDRDTVYDRQMFSRRQWVDRNELTKIRLGSWMKPIDKTMAFFTIAISRKYWLGVHRGWNWPLGDCWRPTWFTPARMVDTTITDWLMWRLKPIRRLLTNDRPFDGSRKWHRCICEDGAKYWDRHATDRIPCSFRKSIENWNNQSKHFFQNPEHVRYYFSQKICLIKQSRIQNIFGKCISSTNNGLN